MSAHIRNIAIIAHVDHGKTTLVDALLKQSNIFAEHKDVGALIMDSMDQEKERGITITSKNASVQYEETRINIIDTPGHADFGGEVERGLRMVDGVILLVDAQEGPMPQTKFVLKKALQLGYPAIVVINKVDKPGATPEDVVNQTFDLFVELGATDEQLDFSVVYASGINGASSIEDPNALEDTMKPLYETILKKIPAPSGDKQQPLQFLVANLSYDSFKGLVAVGKVVNGSLKKAMSVNRVTADSEIIPGTVKEIIGFRGLEKITVESAVAGDIVGIAGFEDIRIGDTIADIDHPNALPPVTVDEPTLQMTFGVNTSPLSGMEGEYTTSRVIKERLGKELKTNVSLRVEQGETPDQFLVSGRGELHLSVLVESMRREGFELQLGKPEVVYHEENGVRMEPYETLYVEVPTEHGGAVMEMLGKRKATATSMSTSTDGTYQHLEFSIPTAGLIGMRSKLITATKGTIVMHTLFETYKPLESHIPSTDHGSIISMESGQASAYALENAQERGILFIKPGDQIYAGQVIGENSRGEDIEVNPCKEKKLTNMRSSGADQEIKLTPPRDMNLENAIDYIGNDELVEVTPESVRIRKKYLDPVERKRMAKQQG